MTVKEFETDRTAGYEMREDMCRAALSEIERQALQSRVARTCAFQLSQSFYLFNFSG